VLSGDNRGNNIDDTPKITNKIYIYPLKNEIFYLQTYKNKKRHPVKRERENIWNQRK
jgi:hypothetical protein